MKAASIIIIAVLLASIAFAECGDGFLEDGERCDPGTGNENRDCIAGYGIVGQCTEWCTCDAPEGAVSQARLSPLRDTFNFMAMLFLVTFCVGVIIYYIHKE